MEDADYLSEEDQDFNPAAADAAHDADSESSEDDDVKASHKTKSVKTDKALDFDNSGDEATIQHAKARRKKKGEKKRGTQKDHDQEDGSSVDIDLLDEDGAEGGLIKTRAQRKAEKVERKPLAGTEGATADVDAIWARLMSTPLKPAPGIDEIERLAATQDDNLTSKDPKQAHAPDDGKLDPARPAGNATNGSYISATTNDDDTIVIKHTYDFAGETHTEEKRVPKDSAEARLYLSSQDPSKTAADSNPPSDPSQPRLRRPLKRPSRFEPNLAAEIRSLPPNARLPRSQYPIASLSAKAKDAAAVAAAAAASAKAKAQRLNTVTKSRLDWAGFVDKEGIADELRDHEKGGKAYLDRMEFLGRVEGRRDAEAREAKGATTV